MAADFILSLEQVLRILMKEEDPPEWLVGSYAVFPLKRKAEDANQAD